VGGSGCKFNRVEIMPAFVLTQWRSNLWLAILLCLITLPPARACDNSARSSPLIDRVESGSQSHPCGCEDVPQEKAAALKIAPDKVGQDVPENVDPPEKTVLPEPPKVALKADAQKVRSRLEVRYTDLMQRELEFIRIACQPSSAEFEQLRATFEKDLKQALKSQTAARGMPFLYGTVVASTAIPPEKRLLRKLRVQAKSIVGPENANRIKREEDLQLASRKKAIVLNLVVQLESRLSLSPRQCEVLVESLGKWKAVAHTSLTSFATNMENEDSDVPLPNIPNQFIEPYLDLQQKEIWLGIGKVEIPVMQPELTVQDESIQFIEAEKNHGFQAVGFLVEELQEPDLIIVEQPKAKP
jgi:hypothetical protein